MLYVDCHCRRRNLTINELPALIDEMAIKYKDDKKIDIEAAKEQLRENMSGAESKLHGTTVSHIPFILQPVSLNSTCQIINVTSSAFTLILSVDVYCCFNERCKIRS